MTPTTTTTTHTFPISVSDALDAVLAATDHLSFFNGVRDAAQVSALSTLMIYSHNSQRVDDMEGDKVITQKAFEKALESIARF